MSRSIATKFMFFCIGVAVIMVLWGIHSSVSRNLAAVEESTRVHTVSVDGVPILVPTPKGAKMQDKPLREEPGMKTLLTFSANARNRKALHIYTVNEMDELTDVEFEPEDFQNVKDLIKTNMETGAKDLQARNDAMARDAGKQAIQIDSMRVIEDTGEFLSIETSSRLPKTGSGREIKSRTAESFFILNKKMILLVLISHAPAEEEHADLLPPLRVWRQAIIDANTAPEQPAE